MSEPPHRPPIDFQQLLALSGDAVLVRDAEDRILFWNRAAQALYGYREDEALGRVGAELLRTEFPQPPGEIADALRTGGDWTGTLVHHHRDGRRVAVRARWTRAPGGPAGGGQVLEIATGIEAPEPAGPAPAPAPGREMFEALVRALPVGIVMLDPGGAVVSMNDAAMRLCGFASREEVLPRLDHYAGQFWVGRPDGTALPVQARPGWAALRGEFVRDDEVILRPLRTGLERRVVCTTLPVSPVPGREPLVAMVLHDITARRASERALAQADERLRENQRRLDVLLDNASLPIFLMDERFHCVYMNPAAERLSGFTLQEMEGRTLHEVVHHTRPDGSHFPIEECPIGESLPGNERAQGEEVFVHKDGSFYPVAFNAAPIRDEAGRILGTILEVRDIRQEKATLEALREADRAKDEFLAMLGHELRNPLSPIVTCLQLMRLRGMHSRELEIVGRQVEHLTRLVDDLLDVSRVTRGLIELRTARVECAEVVARSVEIARPLLEQRQQRLVLEVPESGLAVEADAARLSQVLSNLLVNAAKFSPPRSTVVLRARAEAGRVLVGVKDEGQGIEPQTLACIFEPFVQDRQGKDRSRGGLGLGLAIARNLIDLHGGSIRAHSEGPGRGAEFVVELPQAPQDGPAAPAADRARDPSREGGSRSRVLVVDDNRDVAETLKAFLEGQGHTVLAVFDPATALQKAAAFAPDVAILDIGLPVMDGYELAAKLGEALRGRPAPRLIALSGYGLPRDREHSARAGFDLHLVKPVDGDRLLAALP